MQNYILDNIISSWISIAKLAQDQKATQEIIEKYRQQTNTLFQELMKYCYFILINRIPKKDAQDVASRALLKIYKALHKFNGTSSTEFKSWVYKITLNTYYDWLRKQQLLRKIIPFASLFQRRLNLNKHNSNTSIETISNDSITTTNSLIKKEDLNMHINKILVNKLLKALSPGDRDIILMRYFYGYTHKEIAKIMNISEVAARQRLSRIIKKLKKIAIAEKF